MSTLLQLWREVCGRSPALVNQEGKHLIVSESDCALLGSELERAAPTPAAQSAGQEPIYQARTGVSEWSDLSRLQFERIKLDKRIVYAAPVNGGERETFRCATCRDGELFPQYGVAPHKCFYKIPGATLGQSELLPRSEWPENFTPDAENPQCGTWTCPDCGPRAADAQQVGVDARVAELEAMLTEVTDCLAWLNSDDDGHIMALTDRARAALTSPAKVGVQPAHEQNARFAIDGAISLGMQGVKQPDADHWLAKYWDIGRQLSAKVPDAVMRALDRMSTPLHDSRLSGLTAELDAANIKTIRDYVLSGAVPAKVVGDDQHPDDAAVDRFSVAMKAKLAKKRAQGRGGWDDERICSPDDLARMLVDHVRKGDPVDVGNLAMMLFNRPDAGAALCRAALSADGGEEKVTRSRVLPGEQLLTFPLPEGGKVTLTWPDGISSASIATLSEMLVASALHYMAAEDTVIGPMPVKANQAKGDAQ